jgi:Do/DeqQ family serine protease
MGAVALWLGLQTFSTAGTLPEPAQMTVAPVVRLVAPGVISISTRGIEKTDSPLLLDPDIREMLGIPESATRRETRSAGSGVIVDAQRGYILTNAHVIKGASLIEVTTKDMRRFGAELVGRDPETDIAVLRIKAENLIAVALGDSSRVQVGDFVLAVGNPFGLGQTVTSGIVSALGRSGLGIEGYEDFIQTDASINPGNSGGALVTLDGRLIGINTAILSRTGNNVGIGFAVPIEMARAVLEQIVAHGEVKRGRIGITVKDVTADQSQLGGATQRHGAMLSFVEPGSPAAKAGLLKGDVVTAIDSTPVRSAPHLRNVIGLKRAGTTVQITSERKGASSTTVPVRIEPIATASVHNGRRQAAAAGQSE